MRPFLVKYLLLVMLVVTFTHCRMRSLNTDRSSSLCHNSAWVPPPIREVKRPQRFVNLTPPLIGLLTSGYGPREGRCHYGIDIASPKGSPIRAIFGGVVAYSGRKGSFGKTVIVDHQNGYFSLYAHNHKNLVKIGQHIKKGHVIALVGSTGRSSGPHLHFEIKFHKQSLDPLTMVPQDWYFVAQGD